MRDAGEYVGKQKHSEEKNGREKWEKNIRKRKNSGRVKIRTKMITKRTFSVRDSSLSVCICSRGCYRLNLERAASSATTITFGCICKMDAGTCEVTGPQRAS